MDFNHFYEKKDQHRCTLYIGEAFGRPKDPGAASGRLKILYDYILNNSKILLDTIWIRYSNSDEQTFIEKVGFFVVSENCQSFLDRARLLSNPDWFRSV